jgi:hypothetical protein
VALARTDVSEERIASIIRMKIIIELGTTLAVTRNCYLQLLVTATVVPSALILSVLMMEAMRSPEASILARAIRRHISEDGSLLSKHVVLKVKLELNH